MLAIYQGSHRFSEITQRVEDLSDRMLAQRAKELEQAGLVRREVIASMPVQIRYELTERGADLMRSLQPINDWAQRWRDDATV